MFNRQLEELLERIADGDESALAALYDLTNKLIFSLLMRMLGDAATAEEILINTYAAVWQRAARFKSQNCSALAWLISIARTSAREKFLAKNVNQNIRIPDESLCGDPARRENGEPNFISERYQLVSSFINELSPEQRQTIALAYFSCLNQKEIADRLNLPHKSVKMHLRDGMTKLREKLGNSTI